LESKDIGVRKAEFVAKIYLFPLKCVYSKYDFSKAFFFQ